PGPLAGAGAGPGAAQLARRRSLAAAAGGGGRRGPRSRSADAAVVVLVRLRPGAPLPTQQPDAGRVGVAAGQGLPDRRRPRRGAAVRLLRAAAIHGAVVAVGGAGMAGGVAGAGPATAGGDPAAVLQGDAPGRRRIAPAAGATR